MTSRSVHCLKLLSMIVLVDSNLRDGDATFPSEFLLGLLGGIGVGEVRVEVLVQDLRGLLAEVPPLSPGVQEARSQDHHRLARALL